MKTYGEIIKEIEKAKKTITGVKKAEEKEKRAFLRYEVTRGKIERINPREGVKNWII